MQPQIVTADFGQHNHSLQATVSRLETAKHYLDLSTIVILPAGPSIPTKVFHALRSLGFPPNNKVTWMCPIGLEVGVAYSQSIDFILKHPDLSTWKYILCVEHDNIPPPDGAVRLLAQMEAHSEFAAIGGLYFTKGEGGVAQIWGDPRDPVLNFRPQLPDVRGGLVECCGTGMGFTAFRLEMFKNPALRRPWFETKAGAGGFYTQDLWAWSDFRKNGYRCAIDCSIKVGHYDAANDFTW